tara:strand:- start:2300 stop:2548 length:249 start_codon:yes stop_codon:yes gene_type:complete
MNKHKPPKVGRPFDFGEIMNKKKGLYDYHNKRIRKAGDVSSFVPLLQLNGEILLQVKERAKKDGTDHNDWIIKAILEKLKRG